MEKVGCTHRCKILLVAVCALLMASPTGLYAQSAAEKMLLTKAQSLASSGHLEQAVQTWQQVLLVNANNQEALAGIARADMQLGKADEANKYLDRLKAAGGNADQIARIQGMGGRGSRSDQLKQASQLAQQGRYSDAMSIYRNLFGDTPPAGDTALAYYDTEAAIPADRAHAIAGLRKLAAQFPADSRYSITLGRVLTYDAKTRAEGMSILRQYGQVPSAQTALKQAESWNTKPPAGATETAQQPQVAGPPKVYNSPESSAYRALNSGRLEEAKQQFQNILNRQPNNAGALSGMGYVYMKQQNFASAADYFERARSAGAKGVDTNLTTARFWLKMAQAGDDLKAGNSDAAIEGYRDALKLKSNSPEALEGLGGALAQSGDDAEAANTFEQVVRVNPQSTNAWRGLFLAQSSSGNAQAALDVNDRMPKTVRTQLSTDPDYLRTLAQEYLAAGRKADADKVIAQALALPFPNEGRDLPVQKQLQYAALLMTAKKYEPAIRLYRQVVAQDPENGDAWRALIAAQHQMNEDDEALATVARMPQAVFDQQQHDASFLVLVGSIYQTRHEYDRAQKYLEQALALKPVNQSAIALQLADIYTAQGNGQKAYAIYRPELTQNPQNQQAWLGTLNALHQMNRDREALRQIASMPESVRMRLEQNPSYLQTLATLQSSTGQTDASLKTFARVQRLYSEQNEDMPTDVQIQYGWILLKAGDEQRLYGLVSNLAASPDLTDAQQADLNGLWASWSVQRANASLRAGDQRRGVAILEAAAQAFPKNPDVYNALAAAYLKAGQPKQAEALYAALDMDKATLPQYQGAIGAAMAARDMKQAEVWLQTALDRYKNDPAILKMAAQFEQARGDNERAAAYYRAALDAMPPTPFGGGGPGSLSQPAGGASPYGASPTQQLLQLLAPGGRTAQMSEPADSEGGQRRVDVSWQDAPQNDVPTLGDYAGASSDDELLARRAAQKRTETLANYSQPDQPARPDQQDTGDLPMPAPDTRRESRTRRATARMSEPPPADPLPDPLPAPSERRSGAQTSSQTRSYRSQPADVPLDRDSVSSSVDYMRPASARVVPSEPLPQPRAQDLGFYHPSGFVNNDPNPASRLQLAIREMNGQQEINQNLPQDRNLPELPLSAPQGDNLLNNPPARANTESPVLPPLSGPAPHIVRQKTEREQIEEQLAVLQGAASPWIGGASIVDYRSGHPGYDRLAAYSAQIEGSNTLSPNIRTTVIAQPVLLDTGEPTATETTYQQGTLEANQTPYIQSAAGIGGEFQLRAPAFAGRIGYTPHGFLVENVTAGLLIHPPSSHFTLTFGRDPLTDTQLSYAGLRDLGSKSPTYIGNVWGGVVTNAGELQLAFGDAKSGWYIQGGGQYITGQHVLDNRRIDGDAGAYWGVWHHPEYGNLTVGMNFFGMHYDHNLRYFTYGQGGYFSPASYLLAGVPFTFNGHRGPKFHYRLVGSLGVQAFDEDSTPYYPLDPGIQAARNNPYYPEMTSVGGNYNLDFEGAYAIAEHWYVGGFFSFNNSRDYASERAGFYLRYLFRPQPMSEEAGPTGLFPVQGFRPLQVP